MKVKSLEWNDRGFAHTNVGMMYSVVAKTDGYLLTKHEGSAQWMSFWATEDAAQAAAQTDLYASERTGTPRLCRW